MAVTIVMGAIALAAALGSAAYGAKQQKKAKELAASNVRPTYAINPEIQENQRLAENLSRQGLPQEVKDYYRTSSERGLSAGIDAILKGGGDTSQVGKLYGNYNDALTRLSVADDQRRYENVRTLMAQNQLMSAERDKEFQINKYAPFADKAQEAAALAQQGNQYIMAGLNTGYSGLSNAAQSYQQNQAIKALSKESGVGTTATPASPAVSPGTPSTAAYFAGLGPNPNGTPSTARMLGPMGSDVTANTPQVTLPDYSTSLMNSAMGQSYGQGINTYGFTSLTPKQQADISGLYSKRYVAKDYFR